MNQKEIAVYDMDFTITLESGRSYTLRKYDQISGLNCCEQGDMVLCKLKQKEISREKAVEELEKLVDLVPMLFRQKPGFYDDIKLRPGFNECVDYLKKEGIKPVVITIGDPGVAGYISGEYEIDVHVCRTDKEKLECYQKLLIEKNLEPEQTIMIGDGPHDFFSEQGVKIKMLVEDKEQDFDSDAECGDFYDVVNFLVTGKKKQGS
jgi:2-hydroxy-3-keto-5-methylthiopentenyl-1-phosphate phosphatase